jgi:glucose/arabinose dehydrogenase
MRILLKSLTSVVLTVCAVALAAQGQQQTPQPTSRRVRVGIPVPPLGDGPFLFDTAEQHKIRVVVVTRGLVRPWSLVFLPDGRMMVTERPGRIRMITEGVLDPTPVSGVPKVRTGGLSGLLDVALHPQFAENKLIYFTYTKEMPGKMVATALGRGKLEGSALSDVQELFVSDTWNGSGGLGSRMVFGRDGLIYMTVGGNHVEFAQSPASNAGKVVRLKDDGTPAPGNPFEGRPGYKPEIYTMGHRNSLALVVHPVTGEIWENENGPNGGDEINVLKPGKNYGWPVISFGRTYEGPRVSENPWWREGMEFPIVFWVPSIAVSGMAVYTGDRFPAWKNNVFVGGMQTGEIPGTGHIERVVFNDKMEELRRESMLTELHQRIREVRQGPDGFLYLLTDEDAGALLRIEPAQ